ncbi:GntR family transcriptional regulator [Vibrio sp. E150_011]
MSRVLHALDLLFGYGESPKGVATIQGLYGAPNVRRKLPNSVKYMEPTANDRMRVVIAHPTMENVMVKYLDIYATVKERIFAGHYKSNAKLPDGTSLANEFSCSELTIKKALDILVNDGLVVRKRGSGSYVKQPPLNTQTPKHLYGTKANAEAIGQTVKTQVLNYSVEPASDFLAQRLNCQEGDMLYHITRVRILDNNPNVIEDTYMPINVITGLSKQHIENSIYDYIGNELGLKIHSSTLEITVIPASELEAEHMNLSVGDSVVNVEQVVYLDNGDTFEYSNVKHLCENFKFSTNFVKM